ncbi:signal peptidase I [Flavobacterium aciduliphilum]|uniref:Signal peptidase I n=1 Tax=Flavobacterium aciduliphilum TaxID=1101402 RepID=A0A328YR09_9FLAO|nr:signal peptidase I [Flavobacterium aciduliphilum]RAR75563.1 signal peptidase I [Flavobacterium aciduliphilum]
MSMYQWILFFLIVQVIHFLGTWKLYVKAGRKAWEAAVPVYNSIVLMKIINRPTWWTLLLFIPIINLIMFPVIWVETLRSFGKKSTNDTLLGIFSCGLYLYYINYTQEVTHEPERSTKATTKTGDTISSLLFAVIVATFVHTYFIQPFTIPTSSLEKSLLIGDFLFVSKFNYGARTPMTTVAAPMVHDTLPLIKTKSYLKWPQLPYFRLPGFEKIKKNDIVVFNWPGDTVVKFFDKKGPRVDKPIDKKSNYVKRCVGTPGDSLQIKDGEIFVNGNKLILPERAKPQYSYIAIWDKKTPIDVDGLLQNLKITQADAPFPLNANRDSIYFPAVTAESAAKLKQVSGLTVSRFVNKKPDLAVFPHCKPWNIDNYGPIYIPEEGKKVALNSVSLPLYKRIITEYEGNTLEVKEGVIYINGKKADSYTFKQNYYWMMGDNRHRSEDSRYWGFVPENHIVGKPVFIWMSWDSDGKGILNKIRWERLFTTVNGEGQPQSYFKFFLIFLALYFVGEHFWKKRKNKL